jgi:antitoxin HicB
VAYRHAARSFAGPRIVGSAEQVAAGTDCADSFLCRRGTHDAVARLHQEDSEDSATRYRLGAETNKRWKREEGIYEEVAATAIKRVLARQVDAAMKEKKFSKAEMARRMHTSRAALDRLLDPEYDAVTLSTLRKAATAVGRELRLELR